MPMRVGEGCLGVYGVVIAPNFSENISMNMFVWEMSYRLGPNSESRLG